MPSPMPFSICSTRLRSTVRSDMVRLSSCAMWLSERPSWLISSLWVMSARAVKLPCAILRATSRIWRTGRLMCWAI